MNRLISGSNRTGQKQVTNTIEEAQSFLTKSVKQSKTILLQIGINNLTPQSAHDAFNNFLSLINVASKLSEEVVISFPTPVKLHALNAKVNEFNSFITETFQYSTHITLCNNPNFAREGHVF